MEKLTIDGSEIEVIEYNKVFKSDYANEVPMPYPKPLEMIFKNSYLKRLKKYYADYVADVFVYPIIKIKISCENLRDLLKVIYQSNEYIIENQRYYLSTKQLEKIYTCFKLKETDCLEFVFVCAEGNCEKQKIPKNMQEQLLEKTMKLL